MSSITQQWLTFPESYDRVLPSVNENSKKYVETQPGINKRINLRQRRTQVHKWVSSKSQLQTTGIHHLPPSAVRCVVRLLTMQVYNIYTNKSNYFKQWIENEVSILITVWKVLGNLCLQLVLWKHNSHLTIKV